MGECLYVYDTHRLPVAEINVEDGAVSCVTVNDSDVSFYLKRFVEGLSETGVEHRHSIETDDCIADVEDLVDLSSAEFVNALRDCLNENTFAGQRVVASKHRIESRQSVLCESPNRSVNDFGGGVYLATMRPAETGEGLKGDVMIDISNCRLPAETRYATISGENFIGYGVKLDGKDKVLPQPIRDYSCAINLRTLCA